MGWGYSSIIEHLPNTSEAMELIDPYKTIT